MSTDTKVILDDESERLLAIAHPASDADIAIVLAAKPGDDDGRSSFHWLNLANGDRHLAVAPRGATYEATEIDGAIPGDAMWQQPKGVAEFHFTRSSGINWMTLDGFRVGLFRMENGQVYVGINTEAVDGADQNGDGRPYAQVCLNDATLYDLEKPELERTRAGHLDVRSGAGPYRLLCRFVPQRWENDVAYEVDLSPGLDWQFVWEAEYDEIPASQGSYESDALREHEDAPQWIKDWEGPFEVEFQARYTVVGVYGDVDDGDGPQRYAETFWATDPEDAIVQAKRGDGDLTVAGVLLGETTVVA